ncbi:MAG: integrase core domain-containing protein [Rhodococcus sp. (in: high G+C Gram-positive bacteria)]|uniref:integrase core domain-containing protein n=1 Tax=Rhodococcus sp. TaxID=1831 RepID=UPI002AD759B9|nr:integrase core domain-containing protein [Rhodococcus sp. (in: high G+C Gram-positive bacteria)]
MPPPIEPNQYTSIGFAEALALEGIVASIGSIGDAYDNALAESTIDVFKTEAISKRSPFLTGPIRTINDIEFATMGWGDWLNTRRLHGALDYATPDEFEAIYYSTVDFPAVDVANIGAARNPARFTVPSETC